MPRCAFCERERTLTQEHLWSDWLRDVVVDNEPGPHVIAQGDEIERIWDAQMFDHTVRCVCAECNNGWMSELEADVKPILTPLVLNHRTSLDRDDQVLLATWGVKTALVYQARNRVTRMPAEHFRYLYEHRHPPRDVVVSLAAYAGRRYPVFAGHHIKTLKVQAGSGDPVETRMYFSTVSVGHAVFHVFGHGLRNVVGLRPKNWKEKYISVIWPDIEEPLPWPPVDQLTDEQLRRFGSEI
jgi:hypothetical protein